MLSFMESIGLVIIVYMIFMFIFYKNMMDMESLSGYECGFEPKSFTRIFFSYRFFLISILFIIFDVEISLMLPVPFLMESEMGMWVFIIFLMILILGLLYEYMCGSLKWLNVS
uniref:NADH-ubiquinone oxidoreductase chain 3 n=1 Tax=Cheliceroides longipalpis TaxID=1560386 RepID=A0A481N012_9ARAC|nr:NADH dehydrogenase subunit 3 [Cheliceroides longipalpis]QAU56485.1 NADH dehydrogenase subunit 3 [Cheliceroides longipalpis]